MCLTEVSLMFTTLAATIKDQSENFVVLKYMHKQHQTIGEIKTVRHSEVEVTLDMNDLRWINGEFSPLLLRPPSPSEPQTTQGLRSILSLRERIKIIPHHKQLYLNNCKSMAVGLHVYIILKYVPTPPSYVS